MSGETIIVAISIVLGVVIAYFVMVTVSQALLYATHPLMRLAFDMAKLLRRELGITTVIHSIDEAGIIRLTVVSEFPVAEHLDDIMYVLTLDVRLEQDDKQRPVLAILPEDGCREPIEHPTAQVSPVLSRSRA